MSSVKPIYLIAGGRPFESASLVSLFTSVLAETGKDHPRVAYVGAASGDSRAFRFTVSRLIKKAGAAAVTAVALASDKANAERAREELETADAIFVSGGDVEEGMRWLTQHALVSFLGELYRRGTTFFGLSAGSIMLGRQWVRWTNPDDDASAELFPCLGIAPVLCDTHAEEDDWQELATAVKLEGRGRGGVGIPSGGALRIDANGTLSAIVEPVVVYEYRDDRVLHCGNLQPPREDK